MLSFVSLHAGIRSSLGQPEEVGARLEIKLRGSSSKSGPLQTILLKATVGEAKLCVPRSLEVCGYSEHHLLPPIITVVLARLSWVFLIGVL